ncbi:MAG TPA: ATP-binding protein [Candidatus Binatia bacterium]|jgi:signal transduction histidine kinase/CheY-like chemotaxis protein
MRNSTAPGRPRFAYAPLRPAACLTAAERHPHLAQFFRSDEALRLRLVLHVAAGLRDGESCVVIATRPHLDELESALQVRGIDTAVVARRLQRIDVDEKLWSSRTEAHPDTSRLLRTAEVAILRARRQAPDVQVFVEVVPRLWSGANHVHAIELEDRWRKLQERLGFSLLCAYPWSLPADSIERGDLLFRVSKVRAMHPAQIPNETLAALDSPVPRRLDRPHKKRGHSLRLADEFLSTISHELRTPLTTIIGWSHMLHHERLDEETTASALEAIERAATTEAQLIENILDVSRLVAGRLRLVSAPVDVVTVIRSACEAARQSAHEKGIRLTIERRLPEAAGSAIDGDADRLRQVFWNLVMNAVKFTPHGGRVDVGIDREPERIRVEVRDSGEGIEPAFLPHVFSGFRQADGSSRRRHGGLGLGLTLVRHLVELHGGTVEAASDGRGRGATFAVELPLRATDARPTGDAGALANGLVEAPEPEDLHGVRVLVVDDDRDRLEGLRTMLDESKASVEIAASAGDAFEALANFAPDVLVCDVEMPANDGTSFIATLRESERDAAPRVPVIAVTGVARVEERRRTLDAGFQMFVPKPVEPTELVATIASLSPRHPPRREPARQPGFSRKGDDSLRAKTRGGPTTRADNARPMKRLER